MESQSVQLLRSVAVVRFIQNPWERHVVVARITTQALTSAVTETYIRNQIATAAVGHFPTTAGAIFAVLEIYLADPVVVQVAVEAKITTRRLSVVATGRYTVHLLVIIVVVPLYIDLLHRFAAIATFDRGHIHPTQAVVLQTSTTEEAMCAAMEM